jgi:Pyruvate kinase
MKIKDIKIICTLGPSSFNVRILKKLKKEKIDIFRINLSHTNITNVEKTIVYLKKNGLKNICIDTEGAQIRTTLIKKKSILNKNSKVKVFNDQKISSKKNIYLYPNFNLLDLKLGTIIDIGFNNLKIKVLKKDISKKGWSVM